MKVSKKEKMYQDIKKHGENLLTIFPAAKYQDAVELYKKLRRQELAAHALTTELCNGVESDRQIYAECQLGKIRYNVCQYLGVAADHPGIFINHDPRGYAIKICDEWLRKVNLPLYRDWGGYGIIAPDFGSDNC